MFNNKRAQFYILFAVLVIVIITGLVTTSNYARKVKKPVKFYDLSEDFEAETTKIIDYGIFSGEQQSSIDSLIDAFSAEYLEYVQKKDPNLELIYIFGNEPWALRGVSAIFGILTVLGVYLLTKELFPENRKIALLAAFLIATSFWHIL